MITPVGSIQESVVASIELSSESAPIFMQIAEQKKSIEMALQEARENAFFDPNRKATFVSIDDVIKKEFESVLVSDYDLYEINGVNLTQWDIIMDACLCFKERREKEEPLNRLQSVSLKTGVNEVSKNKISFPTEKVEVYHDNKDEEVIEIYVDDDVTITAHVDLDNAEYYYEDSLSIDVSSLSNHINNFDKITIRNIEEKGKEIMNAICSEDPQLTREITGTEICLNHDIDKLTYIEEVEEENDTVVEDCKKINSFEKNNEEFLRLMSDIVCRGYLVSEVSLEILLFVTGEKNTVKINCSHLTIPRILESIANVCDASTVTVPQTRDLILTRKEIPNSISNHNDKFPSKQELSQEEYREIINFAEKPSFVPRERDWKNKILPKEIVLDMFEKDLITHEDFVNYLLQPHEKVNPNQESVLNAINRGEEIRGYLNEFDSKYNSNVTESILIWEQRKVYRKSNYQSE